MNQWWRCGNPACAACLQLDADKKMEAKLIDLRIRIQVMNFLDRLGIPVRWEDER